MTGRWWSRTKRVTALAALGLVFCLWVLLSVFAIATFRVMQSLADVVWPP